MISVQTQRFAVIGDPINQSLSPLMHNYVFNKHHIDGIYLACHILPDELHQTLPSCKALGFSGINVTIPHKETIINYCTSVSKEASMIGAVNTIIIKDGYHGFNTDCPGFLYALNHYHNLPLKNINITIIGAGGTAKALSVACLSQGAASLTIINRTKQRALALKTHLSHHFNQPITVCDLESKESYHQLAQSRLVINTTPAGMHQATLPTQSMDWVSSNHFCYDVVYSSTDTPFLAAAKQAGAQTADGTSLLAAQAMIACEHFTGNKIPFNDFLTPLLQHLNHD